MGDTWWSTHPRWGACPVQEADPNGWLQEAAAAGGRGWVWGHSLIGEQEEIQHAPSQSSEKTGEDRLGPGSATLGEGLHCHLRAGGPPQEANG